MQRKSKLAGLLMLALSACTANAVGHYKMEGIKPEEGAVFDTRACDGLFICGPWVRIHETNAWRDAKGELHPVAEQASEAGLNALSDPISKGVDMVTVPIK